MSLYEVCKPTWKLVFCYGTKALGFKSFKEELEKHGVKIIVSHKQFTIRGIIKSDYDYVEEKSIKPDY